jgi:hypothetical protein
MIEFPRVPYLGACASVSLIHCWSSAHLSVVTAACWRWFCWRWAGRGTHLSWTFHFALRVVPFLLLRIVWLRRWCWTRHFGERVLRNWLAGFLIAIVWGVRRRKEIDSVIFIRSTRFEETSKDNFLPEILRQENNKLCDMMWCGLHAKLRM